MLKFLKSALSKGVYQPLNKIEISRTALINNLKYLKNFNPKISIAPVLKSNAYGHGISKIAPIVDDFNFPFICVDSIFEAYQLLKLKIKTPILIMGYVSPENLSIKKLPFSYAIWSLEQAKAISKFQMGCGIHIFVDTGMNREGVSLEHLKGFLQGLKKIDGVNIEGVMSHLSSSHPNDSYAYLQMENYEKALAIFKEVGIDPKWKHPVASGGFLKEYSKNGNMVRLGRAIYGLDPDNDSQGKLRLTLTLKSKIVQIKQIKKGQKVGYESTYDAKKDMVIGILPIGYNDGVDRRLSNIGVVKVENVFCQILGRISMNVTTIDLTSVQQPFLGQEVTVISSKREDKNSIENLAKVCGTIPHDLLVHLEASMRREVVD